MWKINDHLEIRVDNKNINIRQELNHVRNFVFEITDENIMIVPDTIIKIVFTYLELDGYANLTLAEYIDKFYGANI